MANDDDWSIHFCQRLRHKRYKNGIRKFSQSLADDYLLEQIKVKPGDVMIDCGANIGELGIWAHKHQMRYIAFEPEPAEARCCDLNNFNGNSETRRQALWNRHETLNFYSKPQSADSSLVSFDQNSEKFPVEAIPLDEFIEAEKVQSIRILKVEGEGAEPEILQGATKALKCTDYVSVDCGCERGEEQQATVVGVTNILQANGFTLIDAKFPRVVFLFRRNDLT